MLNEILLVLIGFLVGIFSGLVGIGGGILIVPALLFIYPAVSGQPARSMQAITAISAVQGFAASITSCYIHFKKGNANLRVIVLLACATVAGAFPGGLTSNWYSERGLSYIYMATVGFIIVFSLWDHFNRKNLKTSVPIESSEKIKPQRLPLSLFLAFGIGYLCGLLGIGGGILLVPLMYNLMGLPLRTAIGSSSGIVFLTAIATIVGKTQSGDLELQPAVLIAAGALGGGFVGAKLSSKVPENVLFWILMAIMATTLLRMTTVSH